MPYQLITKGVAFQDIEAAYNYYEDKSIGLGDRFMDQLNLVYKSISLYPTNFGYIDSRKVLRDILLKIFPYAVIYKIENDIVVIVAVFNCYQNPMKRYRKG